MEKVQAELKQNLRADKLANSMNQYLSAEHNPFARLAPLPLKNLCLGIAYRASMRRSTAAVSNTGVISMPEQFCGDIRAFDLFTGTNRIQACVCSYQDTLSISFTSPFVSADIQRAFFRRLTARGIAVELLTCLPDENSTERIKKEKERDIL